MAYSLQNTYLTNSLFFSLSFFIKWTENHTESERLEGNSGDHLVQPH